MIFFYGEDNALPSSEDDWLQKVVVCGLPFIFWLDSLNELLRAYVVVGKFDTVSKPSPI